MSGFQDSRAQGLYRKKKAKRTPAGKARRLFCLVVLWGMAAMPAAAVPAAAGPPDAAGETIRMNFQDVDLKSFAAFASEVTGKSFLLDPRVQGTVTLILPGPIPMDEVYPIIVRVLESHGCTVRESGNTVQVIPLAVARTKGMDTAAGNAPPPPTDRMVTRLLPLKFANAAEIIKILQPIVSPEGHLAAHGDTETLLLVDLAANIERVQKILDRIDRPGDQTVEIIFLQHADAGELAPTLAEVFREQNRGGPVPGARMIPDTRTNAIILAAPSRCLAGIRRTIAALDHPPKRPRANIHVYRLEHADAEEMVRVVREIPEKTVGAKPQAPSLISRGVQIFSDKATNSLVVIAPPEEYRILADIIGQLDIPRTMVYVEALIVEVSQSRALDLGVEWRIGNEYGSGYRDGGGVWIGGATTGSASPLAGLAEGGDPPSGFFAGVIGRGITLGTVTFPSIAAFVRAARTDSDFNIISTPRILTLDNREAVIEVGQNIPYVTRIDEGTSPEGYAVQNFEYRDVGVTLKVTPSISRTGEVRMQIEQTVQSVLDTTARSGGETILAPTTTFRKARTTIIVQDRETAVLGGLIENRRNQGTSRTPGLGDIPVLGWLFKNESTRDDKTNLLVFITPRILTHSAKTDRHRENEQPAAGPAGGIPWPLVPENEEGVFLQ
jgi:general secretion pathway protein D